MCLIWKIWEKLGFYPRLIVQINECRKMLFYKKYYKEDYPKFFDKFDGERKGKQIKNFPIWAVS